MSTIFRDSDGREWHVKVTVASVDRVLELCGIDLYKEEDWHRVLTEPRLALASLCATLRPALEARHVTDEQFRDALDGDAAAGGIDALIEAVVNFTRPELRATRLKMVDKAREAVRLQADREKARLDSGLVEKLINAEINAEEEKVDRRVRDRFARLSGDSQVDSVSIPEN